MTATQTALARPIVVGTPERLTELLDDPARMDRLSAILGGNPEAVRRFRTLALSSMARDSKIMQADPATVIQAVMDAAALGLEITGDDGAVVAYWNRERNCFEAQFQPGYIGLCKLSLRSPDVAKVGAGVVCAGDEFDWQTGTESFVRHKFPPTGRGDRQYAYAFAKLANGEVVLDVMTIPEVEASRRKSRNADKGPWIEFYDRMARKTVMRRLFSGGEVPRTTALERALELDYAADRPQITATASAPAPEPRRAAPAIAAARTAFLGAGTPEPSAQTDPEPPADQTAEPPGMFDDIEAEATEVTAAPSGAPEPGLSADAFAALATQAGVGRQRLANALDSIGVAATPLSAPAAVAGLTDALRADLADALGIDWAPKP